MDAIGAHAPEPDDSYLFEAIVANLDIDESEVEQAATAEVESTPAAVPETATPVPAAPEATDAPAPKPAPDPERTVAPDLPQPTPRRPLASPEPAASPPMTLDIEAPPELVVPERPVRAKSMIDWCATAFPHLVWLSVVAGLLGQVYGWSKVFGEGVVGWIVAGVFGGVFEFIMVAASSKGLKDLGLGRAWAQVAAFLFVGTACAALAFGMNLTHFTGALKMAGIAAAAATALGYLAHVGVHFFEELDNRRALAAWKAEAEKVEREIKARDERIRAEHEEFQSKQRAVRIRQLEASAPTASTAPAGTPAAESEPAPAAKVSTTKPVAKAGGRPTAKKPGKPELDRATVRDWAQRSASKVGPAEVRQHFTEQGFEVPTDRTLRRWLNENQDAAK